MSLSRRFTTPQACGYGRSTATDFGSLLKTEKKTFPWHDVKDVVVQISRGNKGRLLARLALELQNGRVIPLRFYYSSDVRGAQALQATIRAFREHS